MNIFTALCDTNSLDRDNMIKIVIYQMLEQPIVTINYTEKREFITQSSDCSSTSCFQRQVSFCNF